MRYILPLLLSFVFCVPSQAADTINKMAYCSALIHIDRDHRSWKRCLWLMPGKPHDYQYEWILEDGSVATKLEAEPIKHVACRAPLSETHPNINILMQVGPGLATSAIVGVKR